MSFGLTRNIEDASKSEPVDGPTRKGTRNFLPRLSIWDTQGADFGSIKEYGLNYVGFHNMI